MIAVAPSILAADFTQLGEEVRRAAQGGANRIHVDVMDGHFVPNLSMGPNVVQALRPITALPLEVHLMIDNPERFIEPFVRAGSDTIIVHLEVLDDPRPLLRRIRGHGRRAGVAVKPATPIDRLAPFLPEMDLALCMTVDPGFGGQAFLPESPPRIRRLRQLLDKYNPQCDLEVDGGIDLHTAPVAVEAGANVLVAGTAIFRSPTGPTEAVRAMRRQVSEAAD
ncbi:MAG: ribulose-phosphate 3-epimerase [Gemmataceae bacterium]|nr:ribulose-phosphate 3-epimerase [Gemmataceae bacterium]MDW8267372.1 ribulose-phosphate 3-epimerase [Gemmataceae bacterium]